MVLLFGQTSLDLPGLSSRRSPIVDKVNLEDHLEADLGRQKPLNFAERFESKLTNEGNIMQEIIDNLKVFATERQMVINKEKTSIMKFSKLNSKDFPVEIKLDDSILNERNKVTILGVVITSDLRWDANTEHICKKANKNLWIMRRMKALGMDPFIILDYYYKEIRVHLEYAVPVWHSGLTIKLSNDIERVHRVAVSIFIERFRSQPQKIRTNKQLE